MAPSTTITTQLESRQGIEEDRGFKKIGHPDVDRTELQNYKFLFWEFKTPLKWTNIILITVWHILTIHGYLTHNYLENPWIILYGMVVGFISGVGITAGAHRYWTHRTYKAKLPLRIILLFTYTLAGENSLLEWVQDHRVHHKFSETDADPHNSRRGFFFAHMGWLMMKKHPEVKRKGRQVDCSDILEDPLVVFQQRYFIWLKILICFILPTIIPPLVWGESWIKTMQVTILMRYITVLHCNWLVNSAAHIWGMKPYDNNIRPVDNSVVSIMAFGEGYHNYHHTFPWDYRTAELGSFFNVTTLWLNICHKIGWAYDMKAASPELIKKVVENNGDGSHYRWGHEVPEESEKTM